MKPSSRVMDLMLEKINPSINNDIWYDLRKQFNCPTWPLQTW